MYSENLANVQPTADVCPDAAIETVTNLEFVFGATRKTTLPWVFTPFPEFKPFDEEKKKRADLPAQPTPAARATIESIERRSAVANVVSVRRVFPQPAAPVTELQETRLTPTRRTKKSKPPLSKRPLKSLKRKGECRLRKRVLKFCGYCRWCEVSLHSRTKPKKDCGNSCKQQYLRHGCTKAMWLLYKKAERTIGNDYSFEEILAAHQNAACMYKSRVLRVVRFKPAQGPVMAPTPIVGDCPAPRKAKRLSTRRLAPAYRAKVRSTWKQTKKEVSAGRCMSANSPALKTDCGGAR